MSCAVPEAAPTSAYLCTPGVFDVPIRYYNCLKVSVTSTRKLSRTRAQQAQVCCTWSWDIGIQGPYGLIFRESTSNTITHYIAREDMFTCGSMVFTQ